MYEITPFLRSKKSNYFGCFLHNFLGLWTNKLTTKSMNKKQGFTLLLGVQKKQTCLHIFY